MPNVLKVMGPQGYCARRGRLAQVVMAGVADNKSNVVLPNKLQSLLGILRPADIDRKSL